MAGPGSCRIWGRGAEPPHDHVFRNQMVGRMEILALDGPRFAAVMLIKISSTSTFAYSTKTSKYLSLSKIPVSSSSNSDAFFPRPRFSSTNCVYGKAACGYLYKYFM